MLYPHTELKHINNTVGYGVVASQHIPAGTITWVKDQFDREITTQEFNQLTFPLREALLTYCYRNNKGNYMLCWDNTRFMNHSFSPNCLITPYGFEIAIKDIAIGEQLTNDYGTLNILDAFKPEDEGTIRNTVYPDDLKAYHKEWDILIATTLPQVLVLNQPLRPLIANDVWTTLIKVNDKEEQLRSILECYFVQS